MNGLPRASRLRACRGGRRAVVFAGLLTLVAASANAQPAMSLSPGTVNFGGVMGIFGSLGLTTPPQTLRLTQTGAGSVTWTVSANRPWIGVSPSSGSGPGTITISIVNTGQNTLPTSGTLSGVVTVTATGAANNPTATVNFTLSYVTANPPTGSFDTPANGTTGVTGSIGVTGWAIDDIGISRVRLTRAPLVGEGVFQIPIGDAALVTGARPDVVSLYPTRPFNDRAGWGYLLLTNFLPSNGNGTYTLFAYADAIDGRTALIGQKTITCTNATATQPFGAIDTPTQGGTISGALSLNFGWVLTPQPASIPFDASTLTVFVDSVPLGSPNDGGLLAPRPDLQAAFGSGGYANINNSVGVKFLDTTTLANGAHTIAWLVVDNLGRASGIGSRYFTVSNSSVFAGSHAGTLVEDRTTSDPAVIAAAAAIVGGVAAIERMPSNVSAVTVRHGYDAGVQPELATPDHTGVRHVRTAQLDLVQIDVSGPDDREGTRYRGYTLDGETLRVLPIGSHLDERTGLFSWAPPLAFGGTHDLVFVKSRVDVHAEQIRVRVAIDAQKTPFGDPQLVIDMPRSGATLEPPFAVAGWAIDPRGPANGAGIDTLHAWAYPLDGGDPRWIGVAAYGGLRPDVGDLFGPRFARSGYSVEVADLAPGTYDIVIYAHSLATKSFAIARVLRVSVR